MEISLCILSIGIPILGIYILRNTKGFDPDTVLFTPSLSCKTAGVTGMDDIKPLFMTDTGNDLVHVP
jgi:hypothetical protein